APIALSRCTPPAPPETYTLSLHDALPISGEGLQGPGFQGRQGSQRRRQLRQTANTGGEHPLRRVLSFFSSDSLNESSGRHGAREDRKSTRLNSSHVKISYAVFCLKKKKIR